MGIVFMIKIRVKELVFMIIEIVCFYNHHKQQKIGAIITIHLTRPDKVFSSGWKLLKTEDHFAIKE